MEVTLDSPTQQRVDQWLGGNYDAATKETIQHLIDSGNVTELTDSFYRDLEFGTGGLRGVLGVGSNRMNRYTVGAATQGLSNYINAAFPGEDCSPPCCWAWPTCAASTTCPSSAPSSSTR